MYLGMLLVVSGEVPVLELETGKFKCLLIVHLKVPQIQICKFIMLDSLPCIGASLSCLSFCVHDLESGSITQQFF